MTRRFVAIVLVLAAWIGGTVAGSLGQVPAAASNPGILIGQAHADYTPSLTGSKPIVILAVGSGDDAVAGALEPEADERADVVVVLRDEDDRRRRFAGGHVPGIGRRPACGRYDRTDDRIPETVFL